MMTQDFGALTQHHDAEVSLAQLCALMPGLPWGRAERYLPLLNHAMREADIRTPRRQALFLTQLAHVSGDLRHFEEPASGEAYEGRRELGNTQPGDGRRYKGRGPLRLIGRTRYRAAGRALGIDLESHPTRAAEPEVGFRVAAWLWRGNGLNLLADTGNLPAIIRLLNRGLQEPASLEARYRRALAAFGE
jgi:putative chitinase